MGKLFGKPFLSFIYSLPARKPPKDTKPQKEKEGAGEIKRAVSTIKPKEKNLGKEEGTRRRGHFLESAATTTYSSDACVGFVRSKAVVT